MIKRPASFVSARARTQNVISPGLSAATPVSRGMNSHCGGKIEETETRFCCSMSASRNAYSNAESCCRWAPIPRVRNTRFGIGNISRSHLLTNYNHRASGGLSHVKETSEPRLIRPAAPGPRSLETPSRCAGEMCTHRWSLPRRDRLLGLQAPANSRWL